MPASAKFQALSSRDSFDGGCNTLAKANAVRDWRIYADFAQSLMGIAPPLYAQEPFGVDPQETVYALDTTTIDLCLSVFPWVVFRTAKAAIKLHTLLDLRGNIATFIHISDGKVHEVNILDQLLPEPGAFYIMDRGFLDFERLYRLHEAGSFFVTRGKSNLKVQRRYSHPVDRETGLIKKRLHLSASLYEIPQILSLTMFEKIPLDQLLAQTISDEIQRVSDNQLILFT
jgi:hypothetical protein